jgi:FeS assembly SUF system protein
MTTIPVAPDQPQPDPNPESPAGRAPIKPDPLTTLALKPLIVEALSTIYDPEIPVNIYDLGLIYDVLVDEGSNVEIRMTLTAPGCPAAQTLPGEVQRKVAAVPGVAAAWVELVWEPPWDRDRMSETAKLQLGMF